MAATQWPQQQQQQQFQHHLQPQQSAQFQQAQQYHQYQQNQQYSAQQYQSHQQPQGYHLQQYQQNQQYHAQPHQQAPQGQQYQAQQSQQGQPTQQYQQVRQVPPVAQQYQHSQPNQPVQPYQHSQPNQPVQPYQHSQPNQPVQPYQHSQPNQPVQPYQQQQSQQPQQAHQGYQHQYAPHQYVSQQYAPQQQGSVSQHRPSSGHPSPQQPIGPQQGGTTQQGAYQQARQPQRNPIRGQSPPKTAPQPCFNCGNSGHFAMDCPEPIRAVPAGKLNPQAFRNPSKRPKDGGPVANPSQYTPQPSQPQVSPEGYPQPPYGQTGYPQNPQHQQAYSPTTPLLADSAAQAQYYQQWQQYYQAQQAYQQGNHHQYQGSPTQQQPYTVPHVQAVGYPNVSQTPSHSSVQVSQYTGSNQMYQSLFAPNSASSDQFDQQRLSNEISTNPNKQNQSMISTTSQPSSLITHDAQVLDYDFEEDDLDLLDIPDLPQSTLHFSNASKQSINLIGQPLPGNSIVADALAPFPSPAPQDEGCCRSKYQYHGSLETSLRHFKDSKYWDKEHADDVVFSDISANGKIVPVDEVLSMIRQRRAHPESSDDLHRASRSQSRTVSMNQDSLDVKMTLDRMERELAETKAKLQAKLEKGRAANPAELSPPSSVKLEQPNPRDHAIKEEYQTPPQSATSEKIIKSEQDTEDILAALGVTGTPKPVNPTDRLDPYTEQCSPNDLHVRRSGSMSNPGILGRDQRRGKSNPFPKVPERQANGSIVNDQHNGILPPPPPPPPMPFREQSYPDGKYGSPLSAGLTNGVDHSNGGNGTGYFSSPTDGQGPSPIELRSEKSLSRKRHRESLSDEEDTPKRRQEDDFTPKLKKRQPKVAPAYSRRW